MILARTFLKKHMPIAARIAGSGLPFPLIAFLQIAFQIAILPDCHSA